MTGVTCEYRACTEPSSWLVFSSLSFAGVPSSSMNVLCVCRSPCVRRGAIGTQHAARWRSRSCASAPRTPARALRLRDGSTPPGWRCSS
jgi:hypothetical protein